MQIKISNFILGLSILSLSANAHAYLDPGTGSMIIQAIVGTLAAAMAAGGVYWQKIRSFFTKNNKEEKDKENS